MLTFGTVKYWLMGTAAVFVLTFTGRGMAQDLALLPPSAGTTDASPAEIFTSVTAPEAPPPISAEETTTSSGLGAGPLLFLLVGGCCDTVAESIFGLDNPKAWQPLATATFFKEGWNKPWMSS